MALIEVQGLREFVAMTRKLGAVTLPKQIRKANLDVAREMAEKVAAGAPRANAADLHGGRVPGQLAADIVARATQRVGRVVVGRKLPYAKPIVFGWPKHHIKPNKFPFRVLDAERIGLEDRYREAVSAAIQEAEGAV